MLFKNVASQGLYIFAWDSGNSVGKTGDAANITAKITKDGAAQAITATANPTEIGEGVYWYPLSQAETNCNALALIPSSATTGIQIDPVLVLTNAGTIPQVVFATNGGLPTCDASNRVKALDSTGTAFTYVTPPTTAAIATAILTDTGDEGTPNSLGALIATLITDVNGTISGIPAAVWGYGSGRTLSAFGFSVTCSNLPSDYARNNVAPTYWSDVTSLVASMAVYNKLLNAGTVSDGAPTASSFVVAMTGTPALTAAEFTGMLVCFTSGSLSTPTPQKQEVTSATPVSSTTIRLAFSTPFSAAPSNSDSFEIL